MSSRGTRSGAALLDVDAGFDGAAAGAVGAGVTGSGVSVSTGPLKGSSWGVLEGEVIMEELRARLARRKVKKARKR